MTYFMVCTHGGALAAGLADLAARGLDFTSASTEVDGEPAVRLELTAEGARSIHNARPEGWRLRQAGPLPEGD